MDAIVSVTKLPTAANPRWKKPRTVKPTAAGTPWRLRVETTRHTRLAARRTGGTARRPRRSGLPCSRTALDVQAVVDALRAVLAAHGLEVLSRAQGDALE